MVDDFLRYIENEKLFERNDRILLAVSGGIDSVVMARLFYEAGLKYGIAHCNFRLRGDESENDASFVKILANQLGVPFYNTSFDTNKYTNNKGLSIQMAARNLRYEWFDSLLNEHDYNYVATAHHLNDSIETILYNFTNGTGISGMSGIPPKNGKIVRPLLFAPRKEIEAFARKKDLSWREDSSNDSDKYARNFIRHQVIPQLKKLNQSLEETATNSIRKFKDVEQVFLERVRSFEDHFMTVKENEVVIQIQKALPLPGLLTILYESIRKFGYNFKQATDILHKQNESGKEFFSDTHYLLVDRGRLLINRIQKENTPFECGVEKEDDVVMCPDGRLIFQWDVPKPIKFTEDNRIAYLSQDLLSFPLTLRTWKKGDYFMPLGMTNKKKLSNFMIDSKIPLNLKKEVLVLESGDDIVWVVGQRIDNRYKVTAKSKDICQIKYIPS